MKYQLSLLIRVLLARGNGTSAKVTDWIFSSHIFVC